MARLQLNKSSLSREVTSLKTYERFLPSLDLKRQQLMAEQSLAKRAVAETDREIEAVTRDLGAEAPMLANTSVSLDGLVRIKGVQCGTQNVVGVTLPTLQNVDIETQDYGALTRPHWVDFVTERLCMAMELHMRRTIEAERLAILDEAVKTIRQRVNLFEKVLIPRTKANIKRIKVYLSDEQVSAVVRSKLSKNRHAQAATHGMDGAL
ncbi:MAG: V-type ATP synthase subunit D [Pseudomonadota bacterium]